jgi:hypothetical protein
VYFGLNRATKTCLDLGLNHGQAQNVIFQSVSPEEKAQTINGMFEVSAAGSFLFGQVEKKSIYFVRIKIKNRFPEVDTELCNSP